MGGWGVEIKDRWVGVRRILEGRWVRWISRDVGLSQMRQIRKYEYFKTLIVK
jgi:hypothetical protein